MEALSNYTSLTHSDIPLESESKQINYELPTSGKVGYVIFLTITFIGFLTNLRVIYVLVITLPRKRQRPASLLVAHLSGISICFAFASLFNLSDVVNFINLKEQRACSLVGYLKSCLFSAFSVNIVAIHYERIRTFRECQGKLLTNRLIFLIWAIPVLTSIPAAALSQAKSESSVNNQKFTGNCESVALFGSAAATIIYELFRFILSHVAVAVYLIYGLLKIRSKLRLLHIISPIPNERMRLKVHRIRFIYIHFISFILIWLPVGFLVFLRRTLSRMDSPFPKEGLNTPLNKCVAYGIFSYFILNPLIYLLLIEKNNECLSYCCFCCLSGNPSKKNQLDFDGESGERKNGKGKRENCREDQEYCQGNTSRVSTIAMSYTNNSVTAIVRSESKRESTGESSRVTHSFPGSSKGKTGDFSKAQDQIFDADYETLV